VSDESNLIMMIRETGLVKQSVTDDEAMSADSVTPIDSEVDAGFTLTKAELAEMLFDQVGLNKRESKDMVETFFDEIRGALERGESVKLSGFGNFQLRDKPAGGDLPCKSKT
jgi:integration host factor subunit alpha